MRRFVMTMFAFIGLALAALPGVASANDPVYTGLLSNTAVGGFDAVAYFTEGRPVEGSRDFTTEYQGATWRFSSAENLAAFRANPDQYAPAYGGYCAWAMARGDFAKGDPEFWKIVDGRLYLNFNQDIQNRWEADIPGFIQSADSEWSQKSF